MKIVLNIVAILATLGVTIVSINLISPTSYVSELGNATTELFNFAIDLPEISNILHI